MNLLEPSWSSPLVEQILARGERFTDHDQLPEKNSDNNLFENLVDSVAELADGEVIIVKVGNNKERSYVHAFARNKNMRSCGCNYSGFEENYMYQCKFCKTIYADNELTWHTDWGWTTGSYMGCYAHCYCAVDSDDDEATYYYGEDESPEDQDFRRWVGLNAVIISSSEIELKKNKKKYGRRKPKVYDEEQIEDIRKKLNSIRKWEICTEQYEQVKDKIECPR